MTHAKRIATLLPAVLMITAVLTAGQVRTGDRPGPNLRRGTFGAGKSLSHQGPALRFSDRRFAEDQVLVTFKDTASLQSIEGTLQLSGLEVLHRLPRVNVFQIRIPQDGTVEETIAALEKNPHVASVRPNHIARICATPQDTYFSFQWALYNQGQSIGPPGSPQGTNRADISATAAWEETKGRQDVVIAVIDTGVDLLHPDLRNKLVSSGKDFVNEDDDATDDNGHGTFVSGIAAAETNNNEGIAGVAWDCLILPVKTMDENGEGYYSWIIDGIVWAVDNGADVINLSIGGPDPDPALEAAVRYANENDVVVVSSAGNDAEPVYFPAAYDEYVLAVAATDFDDAHISWSNYGPEIDVGAPGEWIISCMPTWYFGIGSIPYAYGDGTSFSCAFVSGFAALIKSLKDWMSADDIMDVIKFSSDDVNAGEFPGRDDNLGYGRINMEKALVPLKIK